VVLLPHGYPASSFVYRNPMSAFGHRWRSIAPDLPGFGYSATPLSDDFGYTFDAYATFRQSFVDALDLNHYVIWLYDYGSQFGPKYDFPRPLDAALVADVDSGADRQPDPPAGGPTVDAGLVREGTGLPEGKRPPTLIVWGPHDGYMPEKSARAYLRELPDVPTHLLGGGHWLLATHLEEAVPSPMFLRRMPHAGGRPVDT
jgi:pimeloyl-ACP methyl ester carboxylesterase